MKDEGQEEVQIAPEVSDTMPDAAPQAASVEQTPIEVPNEGEMASEPTESVM